MKTIFFSLLLIVIAVFLVNTEIYAQATGDYVATTSGDYNVASNWSVSDGSGGFSGVATTAPTTAINIWIPEGKVMTIAAASNAQNMNISGELNCGNFTVNLGTNANTSVGNLTITSTGKFRSSNATGGTVNSLNVYGTTIQVDGQLGAATSNNFTSYNAATNADGGGGFRVYCMAVKANETTTVNVSGTGKINIARLYGSNQTTALAHQIININTDINILNNNSISVGAFGSIGNTGGSDRSINIYSGKTVKFTGSTPRSSLHRDAVTSSNYSSGDFIYNVFGTLDMGKGTIRLYTSYTSGNTKGTYLNIKNGGTLVVGDTVRLQQGQANGQTCGIFPETGSTVKFGQATGVTIFKNNLGAISAPFPTTYSNIILDNTSGFVLNESINLTDTLTFVNGKLTLGEKDLILSDSATILNADAQKYIITNGSGLLKQTVSENDSKLFPVGTLTSFDPASVKPTSTSVFSVKVSNTLSKEVPLRYNYNLKEWQITPVTPSLTEITLTPANAISTAITDVIGQLVDSTYSNVNAARNENSYTASFSIFGAFVTGTSDIGTSIHSRSTNDLFVTKIGQHAIVNGTKSGQIIDIYNVGGILIERIIANGNQTELNLESGVYILKFENHTQKVVL